MARTVTPTQLRNDLYRLLDQVIETGEPLRIERDGHVLHIVSASPATRRDLWSRPQGFRPCVPPGVTADDLTYAPTAEWEAAQAGADERSRR